jgi:putative NADPH-quinone reductase
MNCLIIHAHPDPDSFNTALRERAVATLVAANHQVEVIDLYGIGYTAAMSEQEHIGYYTNGLDHPDAVVAEHIEQLRRAQMLVFIYPTWWSGIPAVMKGWLDRTFLPEVAFTLGDETPGEKAEVRGNLDNIKRLVGVTTYGSKRTDVLLLGDAGRRTISRTVRLVCARRCRTTWLGLHQLDTAPPEKRAGFLDQVETTLTKVAGR